MRRTVGERFGVKAAGGIRTYRDCVAMIEAGANRIGTSSAIQILKECPI
jgi:deoxyribose-phosphate aldolase